MISFRSPLVFLLVLAGGWAALAVLSYLARKRRRARENRSRVTRQVATQRGSGPPRLLARSVLRALALLALAIAAGGPTVPGRSGRRSVVIAVDLSKSVGDLAAIDAYLRELVRALPSAVHCAVTAFGGKPLLVLRPGPGGGDLEARARALDRLTEAAGRIDSQHSDLAVAIRHGRNQIPAGDEGHVLIVTDGIETRGDAVAEAALARQAGVSVHAAPWSAAQADFRVDRLLAPLRAVSGETISLEVVISGTVRGELAVTLQRQGADEPIGRAIVQVQRGEPARVVFTDTPTGAGYAQYVARIEPAGTALAEAHLENNLARAATRLTGPENLLVVSQSAQRLKRLLEGAAGGRFTIDPALPAMLGGSRRLTRYAAIVLENVPRAGLSGPAGTALAAYVAGGGGILVIGGPRTLGAGGWRDEEPLPGILPVTMRPRETKRAFVVFVLDRSGSMGHKAQGGRTKLEFVREATGEVLKAFDERDQVALVAFSRDADLVLKPTPASDREKVTSALIRLEAAGSTNIINGLRMGFELAMSQEAEVRHVLLLSDGISQDEKKDPAGQLEALVEQIQRSDVSLSTVGIGDDKDRELLGKLHAGGGKVYFNNRDLQRLRKVFAEDIQNIKREWVRDEPFQPRLLAKHEIAAALEAAGPLPAMRGRNRTAAKSRAQVVIDAGAPVAAGVGPAQQADPILAVWHHGLGRAAVLAGWLDDPRRTAQIIEPTIRWLLRRHAARDLTTRIVRAEDRDWVVVTASDAEGRSADKLDLAVRCERLSGPADAPGAAADRSGPTPLEQVGLGRYRARFGHERRGLYLIEILRGKTPREQGAARRLVDEIVHAVSYPDELRSVGLDRELLARLARAGGGRIIDDPHDLAAALRIRRSRATPAPLAWIFTLAAAALMLAEIAVRAWRG